MFIFYVINTKLTIHLQDSRELD